MKTTVKPSRKDARLVVSHDIVLSEEEARRMSNPEAEKRVNAFCKDLGLEHTMLQDEIGYTSRISMVCEEYDDHVKVDIEEKHVNLMQMIEDIELPEETQASAKNDMSFNDEEIEFLEDIEKRINEEKNEEFLGVLLNFGHLFPGEEIGMRTGIATVSAKTFKKLLFNALN